LQEFREGFKEFRKEVTGTRNRYLFLYSATLELLQLLKKWPFMLSV
jgi:hypothetical protein